jgi:hypothetical protein
MHRLGQLRLNASQGRDATWVRVMNLEDGQIVAAVARVAAEVEEGPNAQCYHANGAHIATVPVWPQPVVATPA